MKTKIFLSFLVFTFLFSCTPNENKVIPIEKDLQTSTLLNQSYGSDPKQNFDLYLPANRTENKTKTIILVHGGGWIEGDKNDMNYLIPIIKQNFPDYAIANINYRLANTSRYAFPMQNDDLNTVFNKLKNDNNSISDDFGFIGTSAGGHLSMLYSYSNNPKNNIKMVISIVGPTNFKDVNYTNNPAWLANYFALTGINYTENPSFFEQLSPLFKVTSTSPPTLLLYGDTDPLIPNTQHQDLKNKLTQLGVYNELKVYNGGHGNWSPTDLSDASARLVNFVRLKF